MRILLIGMTLAACGGSAVHSVPTSHRATADACAASDRPAGNCGSFSPNEGECTADAQCTGGDQGRCFHYHNGECTCNYNSCKSDADCLSNQLCGCSGTFGLDPTQPNSCVASNCRTDADCGKNGYCSPSFDVTCGAYFGVVGFYCHTSKDSCGTDSDCGTGGVVPPYCAFNPEVGHWSCSTSECAG